MMNKKCRKPIDTKILKEEAKATEARNPTNFQKRLHLIGLASEIGPTHRIQLLFSRK